MKKIILTGFALCCTLFITAALFFSTTWSGTASNQAVTLSALNNAASTGVFTAKTSIPTGLKCITKAEAATYVYLDISYSPFANKATNQLVVKSDLIAVSAPPTDPSSATLTLTYSSGVWRASLSQAIPSTTIEIYQHSVQGFSTTSCTAAEEGGSSLSLTSYSKMGYGTVTVLPLEVVAGYTTGTQNTGDLTCQSIGYRLGSSIYINGVQRTNGATFTIGGTTVTLVIDPTACTVYPC